MSNFVGRGQSRIVKRWDKIHKKYVLIEQPEIIDKYNNGMGGVDLLDQLLSYYRIFIKSKKWTLRVIFHFIDLAVCASYIEYLQECKAQNISLSKSMKLLDFKLSLGNTLTQFNPANKKRTSIVEVENSQIIRNEVRPPKDMRLSTIQHMPGHDDNNNASRCKLEGCKGKSRVFCITCDVHLCLNKGKNCFQLFHSQ